MVASIATSLGLKPRRMASTIKMPTYMGTHTHFPETRFINWSKKGEWKLLIHSSKAASKSLSVFII